MIEIAMQNAKYEKNEDTKHNLNQIQWKWNAEETLLASQSATQIIGGEQRLVCRSDWIGICNGMNSTFLTIEVKLTDLWVKWTNPKEELPFLDTTTFST